MIDTNIQNGIIYQIRQKYGVVCDTDTYKMSHHPQYRKNATRMISYIESRGGKYDRVLNVGIQLIVKEFFLQQLTHKQVDNLIAWEKEHFNGNCTDDLEIALRVVVDEYDGWIPIIIRNAPEGLMIPVKNVLATIESAVKDNRIFSLVSYFETKLLRVWNTMTIGAKCMSMREQILKKLSITSDIPNILIEYMVHDFGGRACTAMEQAAFGSIPHLVAFRGSDTSVGIMAAEIGYHCRMAGKSIPASEHSSTTSWGVGEEEAFVANMFDTYCKKDAIFATVIDSEDAIRFVRQIAPKFKQRLINSGAMKWVFRPDSAHPVKMPLKIVDELDLVFGHTVNSKGYKVLNGVGVIQGDGIGPEEVDEIMDELIAKGWCVSNICFGMGGNLHQKHDRDTCKFSMKCCAIEVDDVWYQVFKNPAVYDEDWNVIQESSFKLSKKGRLELLRNIHTGEYVTESDDNRGQFPESDWEKILEIVFNTGELVRDMDFDEVRHNAGTL